MMEKINLRTTKRIELIDITDEIQKVLEKSKVKAGICFIFCPHTTAGLTINENADPSVKIDILNTLNKLVPANAGYTHTEGNADSHVKSSLFGASLTIFVENNQLVLGTWQGIYFCEGDGPRSRQVWVKIMSNQ
ncbi:MAG: secondary thiamine-phosphate synthase enzyme YjbQ [Candidatus Omnitrophica bacterium]|nr:secondary thiamine-phosphate synthase enzyme YjbQ [Candidatus Omnitrophota bacterium]MCM8770679.1 secondary thiamine-phosphate synthase enzyme YjbQ [Candidatus Omnitrophota bacterium]